MASGDPENKECQDRKNLSSAELAKGERDSGSPKPVDRA